MKPFDKLRAVLLQLCILMKLVVSVAPAAQGCVCTETMFLDGNQHPDHDLAIQNNCSEMQYKSSRLPNRRHFRRGAGDYPGLLRVAWLERGYRYLEDLPGHRGLATRNVLDRLRSDPPPLNSFRLAG